MPHTCLCPKVIILGLEKGDENRDSHTVVEYKIYFYYFHLRFRLATSPVCGNQTRRIIGEKYLKNITSLTLYK